MTTITVKLSDPAKAEMLEAMLSSMDFVAEVIVKDSTFQVVKEVVAIKPDDALFQAKLGHTHNWDVVHAELRQRYEL